MFTTCVRSFQLNRSAVIPANLLVTYVCLSDLYAHERTALFLKERQLEKLQTLSRKTALLSQN